LLFRSKLKFLQINRTLLALLKMDYSISSLRVSLV